MTDTTEAALDRAAVAWGRKMAKLEPLPVSPNGWY